ncbi:MAG: chaperonin GroEL [Terriglobales bacterium]
MTKRIIPSDVAREAILKGANLLADQIKLTLGPKGRNVVIEKKFGVPTVTKDGVTVAREFEFGDAVENMGAQMVREVTSKTYDSAGDGTTTAVVLVQAIYREGARSIATGANPAVLKVGIERAAVAVTEELEKLSRMPEPNPGTREVVYAAAKLMSLPTLYERTVNEGVPETAARTFVDSYKRASAENKDLTLVEQLAYAARAGGLDRDVTDKIINKALRTYADIVEKSAALQRSETDKIANLFTSDDPTIRAIVAEAMTKLGKNGVFTIEEGQTVDTQLEFVKGMEFDRGYLQPYFVTDTDRMEAILERPYILFYEKAITSMKGFLPLLEQIAKSSQPLLIIAGDVEGEALATLVVNRLRGTLQVCAVKGPGSGEQRKAMLQDIAILVGGKVINEEPGTKLENVQISDLGRARRITVDKDKTLILEGEGAPNEIDSRIEEIRGQIKKATDDYQREKLHERLAKFVRPVALIEVGAATETDMKQKKTQVENAISSARAVLEEGFVPGGGVALARCAKILDSLKLEGDKQIGVNIMKRAITEPLRQIAENAGEEGAVALGCVWDSENRDFGFNAQTGEYEDLVKAGVVDPTKIVRIALQNATSMAVLMLTEEALVAEIPEEKVKAPEPGRGGMEGMY